MNNITNYETFRYQFEQLNITQKSEFSRLANKLLGYNFICKDKDRDRNDYLKILQNIDLYRFHFNLIDFEVNNDQFNGVISIKSRQTYSKLRLTKDQTLLLLILRKLYFSKQSQLSMSDKTVLTQEEIRSALNATNIYDVEWNKTTFVNHMLFTRRLNICDFVGDISHDETTVILYPSIIHVIDADTLDDLEAQINSYKGVSDEAADED